MAEVMAFVSIILGLAVAWPCLVIWMGLVFPQPVARAQEKLTSAPVACFFIGLGQLLVPGGVAFVLLNHPNGLLKIAGWVVISALLLASTLGGAAIVRMVAERLGPASPGATPLRSLVRAAVLTEFAALFPLIGWLIFLPLSIVVALGAASVALLFRERRTILQPAGFIADPSPVYQTDPTPSSIP